MASEEYEYVRATRVKELEDMVQKLEQENKQLLHKVRAPGVRPQQGPPRSASEGDLEDDLINLSDVEEGGRREDEWLFISPVHPPTPSQKVLTPVEWLSAGHTSSREGEVPSLDDVRLALSFPMSEAESLSTPPRHPPPRGYGAESSSPKARQPANRTARRYLDQVRMRRSPPNMAPGTQPEDQPLEPGEGGSEDEAVPVLSWKARPVVDPSASDDIPVVKWKARAVVDPSASDDVPVVKWKARAVVDPHDLLAPDVPLPGEDIPVVRWKANNVPSSSDDVPVVKWKPQNADDDVTPKWKVKNVPSSAADVPVVKWKARVPPSSAEEEVPRVKWNPAKQPADDVPVVQRRAQQAASPKRGQDEVPVVQWRAKQATTPKRGQDEVPVVQWKAQQAASPKRGQDEVPVVQWKAQVPTSPTGPARRTRKPKNMPVKAVITQGRLQREQNESSEDALSEDSYGEGGRVANGGDSDSQLSVEDHLNVSYEEPRPSRYTTHYQQSPDSRHRSPGGLPRPVVAVSPHGSPSLRSRSPSPSIQYSATVRSRSPSPSVRYGDRSTSPLLRHSPQSARRQILPPKAVRTPRSPSPVSRASQQPQAKVPSPSGSPLMPRKPQSANSSLPAASVSAVRHSSPGRPPSGLPPTGTRPRQSGLKTPQSSPASASAPSSRLQPRATGLTPPARAQGTPKRVLPSPPNSGLRTPGRTRESPHKSLPPRAKPPPAPAQDDDNSWLEGCF